MDLEAFLKLQKMLWRVMFVSTVIIITFSLMMQMQQLLTFNSI